MSSTANSKAGGSDSESYMSADEDSTSGDFSSGPAKEFLVLLLGETGVGKSTFINAFANYLTFSHLKEAAGDTLISLIPTKFTVTDENFEEREIEFGKSENEVMEVGVSATQYAKSYIFPLGNIKIRLIDTPGIGDTRGTDQDNINFENLLNYLGEFTELHAICILLKPNSSRITVMFEYCIKQLLCRLDKSASENMIFIFTNSRSTFYRPGDTLPSLRKVMKTIENRPPFVQIPLTKQNIFCVDNESFRFLVASTHGITFNDRESEDFAASWSISAERCNALLIKITELKPHQIQDTISVNEARRLIAQLSRPLAEIANLSQINIEQLKRQKQLLQNHSNDVVELKKNLYIPVTQIRVEELDQPTTVCTDVQCCEVYQVNGNQTYHYKQVCHNPCYLKNVPKEIVGSPELLSCYAMQGNKECRFCKCSYLKHMHIYYKSFPYEDNIVDENINQQITTKSQAKKAAKELIEKIEERRQDYENEKEMIVKSTAKFAHFLQNNAITAYNDAYKAYLEYLIDRENSLGHDANKANIENYKSMLNQYLQEKMTLDNAFEIAKQGKLTKSYVSVSPGEIMSLVKQLYELPHCGPKIKELFNTQNKSKNIENCIEHEVNYSQHMKKKNGPIKQLCSSFKKKFGFGKKK